MDKLIEEWFEDFPQFKEAFEHYKKRRLEEGDVDG